MKRPFILAFIILMIDQGLKTYFQYAYIDHYRHFGFTYVVNDGLWIGPNISNKIIYLLFLFAFLVWCFTIYLLRIYQIKYRKSIVVDFAFAFYTVGIIGNMIDKLIFGYIRDFFVTPYVICNLADLSGFIGLFIFIIEFLIYPKSRDLLKIRMSCQRDDDSL